MRDQAKQYKKMTETPIAKLIIMLSIPTIINMLVTNIYNLVDTAFVGRLGNSASGAVGIVFGYMAIIQAFGFMFGQGGGSIVSRLLGARDTDSASKNASTAFFFALGFGLVLAVLSYIFMDPLIMLLGSTDTIAPYARDYIGYIMIAAPFMTASFTMNNVLRYEGKAALGMVGLLTGSLLNMIGDPIFMFGLKMGVGGAGLSTCISQITSFCILLSAFLKGQTTSKISIYNVHPSGGVIFNICATGLPSLLRQGLGSIATIILNSLAGVYGDEAVAAMSIVSRISFFIFSIALGVGQGFQPVSAFNYGAGKYSRVRKGYVFTFLAGECLMLIAIVAVFINAGGLIGVFRDDPKVIEIGTRALRLHIVSLVFLPLSMVTEMLYQSTGHSGGASVLSSLRSGIFFIPALLILSALRGLAGIQEAQPLAYVLTFFPSLFFCLRLMKNMPAQDREDTSDDIM
ncbi:MAG: MATE family efflux transporter [Lachnospiraceae bacterium]|nr:MATE family efflux transporter [Lachnospiraceae bacterium]